MVEWMNKVEDCPGLLRTLGFDSRWFSSQIRESSLTSLAKSSQEATPSPARRRTSTALASTMLEQQFTMQNFESLPPISVERLKQNSTTPLDRSWYRLKGYGPFNAIRRLPGASKCVMAQHADEEWECVSFKEGFYHGPREIPTKLQRWSTGH